MPGPQETPGTCACSDLSNTELVKGVKAISMSLDDHLQKLANSVIEALQEIQISAQEPVCSRSLGLSSYKPA